MEAKLAVYEGHGQHSEFLEMGKAYLKPAFEKGWNAALEEAVKVLSTPRSCPYLNDMVNEIRGLKK